MEEGTRYKFIDTGNGLFSLVISECEDDDTGEYCCVASNSAGRVTAAGNLFVKGERINSKIFSVVLKTDFVILQLPPKKQIPTGGGLGAYAPLPHRIEQTKATIRKAAIVAKYDKDFNFLYFWQPRLKSRRCVLKELKFYLKCYKEHVPPHSRMLVLSALPSHSPTKNLAYGIITRRNSFENL